MINTLIDNDILIKGACYGVLSNLLKAIPASPDTTGILGEARFVVSNKIKKKALNGGAESAIQAFSEFLDQAMAVEPTEEEKKLAAELEFQAQRLFVNLDSGESLLCSILILRSLSVLATGDKRAIAALESLLCSTDLVHYLSGKVLCLEQLFLRLINNGDPGQLRTAVCSEPAVDRGLANCFSCASPEVRAESFVEGLQSYIDDLRRTAPNVLSR
jgi:hypothetical protein